MVSSRSCVGPHRAARPPRGRDLCCGDRRRPSPGTPRSWWSRWRSGCRSSCWTWRSGAPRQRRSPASAPEPASTSSSWMTPSRVRKAPLTWVCRGRRDSGVYWCMRTARRRRGARWRRKGRGGARGAARTRTIAGAVSGRRAGPGGGARRAPGFVWRRRAGGRPQPTRRGPRGGLPDEHGADNGRTTTAPTTVAVTVPTTVAVTAPTTAAVRVAAPRPGDDGAAPGHDGTDPISPRHPPGGCGSGDAGDRGERLGYGQTTATADRVPARRDGLAPGVRPVAGPCRVRGIRPAGTEARGGRSHAVGLVRVRLLLRRPRRSRGAVPVPAVTGREHRLGRRPHEPALQPVGGHRRVQRRRSARAHGPVPVYDYGAVIAYNTSPTVPGAGSAIFLHVSGGGATSGCVALPTSELLAVLALAEPRRPTPDHHGDRGHDRSLARAAPPQPASSAGRVRRSVGPVEDVFEVVHRQRACRVFGEDPVDDGRGGEGARRRHLRPERREPPTVGLRGGA